MARIATHEQAWCETCQESSRQCNGDHAAVPISTPLHGVGWADTDYGAEFPRVDVFATWVEYEDENPVPAVYIGACSPGRNRKSPELISGYLDLNMAQRLRDALTESIDNIRLTLSGNHHLLCDCGDSE